MAKTNMTAGRQAGAAEVDKSSYFESRVRRQRERTNCEWHGLSKPQSLPSWHISSIKTTPTDPSQTGLPIWHGTFKYVNLRSPFLL